MKAEGTTTNNKHPAWAKRAKRLFDIVAATILLLVLAPVLFVLVIVIRITMGSPVVFKQVRPGLHGRPFTMYKFRTMTDARDEQGNLLPDGERLTTFGRFLRSSSLDELPELLNVIKGDMSLVGPRPLLMKYMPFYSERERLRFHMRPGITGLAQINGRNTLAWGARLELDVQYVENWSFLLDMKILLTTVSRVIRQQGIEADPRSVMLDLDEERISQHNATEGS